jgi:hypothetical protein
MMILCDAQMANERRPHPIHAGQSGSIGALVDKNGGMDAVASFRILSSNFSTCSYFVNNVLHCEDASSNRGISAAIS